MFFYAICIIFIVSNVSGDQACDDAEVKFDDALVKSYFAHPHSIYPDNDQLFDKYCNLYRSMKPLLEKIVSCSGTVEGRIATLLKQSVDKSAGELCSKKRDTINLFKCMSKKYRKHLQVETNRALGLYTLAHEEKSQSEILLHTCCIAYSMKHFVSQGVNVVPSDCPDRNINVTATYGSILATAFENHIDKRCTGLGIDDYKKCIENYPEVHSYISGKKDHDFQAGSNGQRIMKGYVDAAKKHYSNKNIDI